MCACSAAACWVAVPLDGANRPNGPSARAVTGSGVLDRGDLELREGSYEVAGARSRRQAESIIDAVIEYARRLMAGGVPPRV